MLVIGYARRSTEEQPTTLEGQRRCPDDVLARVLQLRAAGARLVDIAGALNADGVPTPGGGARWWPSHVSRLLATQDVRRPATAGPEVVGA